jgi:GAF domain-containing protein
MWASIRKFIAPPIYPDNEEKTRKARYLNTILLASIILLALFLPFIAGSDYVSTESFFGPSTAVITFLLVVMVGLFIWMRFGFITQASFTLVILTWLALTAQDFSAAGIRDTIYMGYIVVVLLAGLLLDVRYSIGVVIASILAGWVFAFMEASSMFIPRIDTAYNMARDFTVIFILVGVLTYITISGLQNAIGRLEKNAMELQGSNQELRGLQINLEERVQQRTNELALTTEQTEKRARQLQTVADVARATASVQDLETLLPTITKVISEQFGYYHSGIFLNDERGEFAVLKAASSDGGKRMLDRGHALRIGEQGIVGYVSKQGQPRIALDTGRDAVYFNNPDLPTTRSEAALPLIVGGKIIGVLDVQSQQQSAFLEPDINVLSTLANLVAVAIENARLFGQTNRALTELQDTYARFSGLEWEKFFTESQIAGYRYSGLDIEPIKASSLENISESPSADSRQISDKESAINIPIKLRGQTLGYLAVKSKVPNQRWGDNEEAFAQAAADRVALALENARLLQSAQKKAAKEQKIVQISNKISATSNLDNILLTAIVELGQAISDSEVIIQFDERE